MFLIGQRNWILRFQHGQCEQQKSPSFLGLDTCGHETVAPRTCGKVLDCNGRGRRRRRCLVCGLTERIVMLDYVLERVVHTCS